MATIGEDKLFSDINRRSSVQSDEADDEESRWPEQVDNIKVGVVESGEEIRVGITFGYDRNWIPEKILFGGEEVGCRLK